MVKPCKSLLSLQLLLPTPVQAGVFVMPGSEHLNQKTTLYNQAYAS